MIKLSKVSKSYGGGVKAVDSLDLHVVPGEIFGFLGPNGAGKTTTIKMLVGILQPDEGSIEVNGISMADNPIEAKKQLGYVPDEAQLWDKLTGAEYLDFICDVYGVPGESREARALPLLETFEMLHAVNNPIGSYSRGMRQKIALIGSLLHRPPVWVLDEPMVGLDPRSSYLLKELMRSHVEQGGAVFFSTHVLEVAERLCDRVGIIHKGKLIAVNTVSEMKELFAKEGDKSLEEIFLEVTGAKLPQEQLASLEK
ncbi:MAG: ABC transporter ATP-binding protein [Bacillota bacterium]|nr:ABC transporter ATP-binding protein [Candidatus Fermentithermobacillaceae bacterium]HAF66476.1 3-dehydroquinate dehydratase [Clostridiales bacterium UBA9857]HOA70747.1 ABC transporter ATP-binding protein [Bacillota bacterium]HOP70854.1 ABC transporter ATP-binding protein [Bacillota bacterium]HPT35681.1 ABC transporter ATP-binding protein [Bacillota bacterium]